MSKTSIFSRRNFVAASTAMVVGATHSHAGTTKSFSELESRLARRELKDIFKEDLPTPCMVVDQEIFESNLKKMAEHCTKTGIHLRAHVKIHKSTEIARRQLALGAIGLTCATVAECELMAHAGFSGILLTRQPTSKNNIARVVALAKRDATFGTVVDDPQAAAWLQDAAGAENVKLRTVVDVYAGLSRHGIEAGRPALDLAKQVDSSKNLKLYGIMGYAGAAAHTHGFEERLRKSRGDSSGMLETVASARSAGLPVEIITGGSTGTYNIDSELKGLTELQAGSFVFMDTLYRQIGGKNNPASFDDFGSSLTVLSTVISKRHPGQCTIDAGNKALLKPTDEVKGRPHVKVENQGAEYGLLVWKDGERDFKIGERVEIYPSNLDMSTNVYDRYYVTRGERVVDVWPIMGRSGAAQR
ncbi:MAG TPA: alanine racemase [Bryobacteraceae bacterium]|nr:alanine racemase [Bryobacteraceae bacterium]